MSSPDPLAPSIRPHRLLVAAQLLAVGETVAYAAARAGIDFYAFEHALENDRGVKALVAACEERETLEYDVRMDRLDRASLNAAEQAVAEGRVSTINLAMRSRDLFKEEPLSVREAARLREAEARTAALADLAAARAASPDPDDGPLDYGHSAPLPCSPVLYAIDGDRAAADPATPSAAQLTVVPPTSGEAPADEATLGPAAPERGPDEEPGAGPDPFIFPAAADPAAGLNDPRPNPNGLTIPTKPAAPRHYRIAKEPISPWHRGARGWYDPQGS